MDLTSSRRFSSHQISSSTFSGSHQKHVRSVCTAV